jgi:hypothetical protein
MQYTKHVKNHIEHGVHREHVTPQTVERCETLELLGDFLSSFGALTAKSFL